MQNNPSNLVTVIAEKDICINTTEGFQCISKGEEVTIKKSDYAHCLEPRVLKLKTYCEPLEWLITIAAGTTWKTEVPENCGGVPAIAKTDACDCLLVALGTASKPLDIPTEAEIKENSPGLLHAGANTISLSEGGELAEEFALVNCNAEEIKVKVIWEGCV